MRAHIHAMIGAGLLTLGAASVQTATAANCPADHDTLEKALKASVKPSGGPTNGGLDNNEWAALVTRDGVVCAVAFSGAKPDDQWPGSRAIAAEKASTANALSLAGFALSTANLFAGVQPDGFSVWTGLEQPRQHFGSLCGRSGEVRIGVGSVRRQIAWRRHNVRRRARPL